MISLDQITFVITTFKSEKIIFDCINELPNVSPKIIIENSRNNILKNDLENKFENLECFVMSENIGYGKANNIGISKSKTNYIFIINPDTLFSKKNLNLFLSKIEKENFSIASMTASSGIAVISSEPKLCASITVSVEAAGANLAAGVGPNSETSGVSAAARI